jgi:AAA15 family ATPase/GTPase
LNLLPALRSLWANESVYFIDEIDRSLHPKLAWEFIQFFLNGPRETNSQLVVITHDTNLLDLDLLRRDEIWFAEKDQQSATHLYSLTDFQVRKDLQIRKHYLEGRFGAVPFMGDLERLIPKEPPTA